MDKLISKLGIDESMTKPIKKPKIFNKIKNNIPLKADYNFMADLLVLPEDKNGFKYLLVIVDLATDEFDIEPMKNKEASTTLKSMKIIFKRKHLNKPYASMRTDAGNEFKGVFHQYLFDISALHRVALPDRHSQLANVERLNRELGRLFNGYMNKKEIETGKEYKNWTDVVPIIREELNKIRIKNESSPYTHQYALSKVSEKSKFQVGDIVLRMVETPFSALGKKQNTNNFRMGDFRWDVVPRKVKQVFAYQQGYRYQLEGFENVSYADHQLQKSNQQNQKFVVRKIIDKRKFKNRIEYKIWWQGFKKADATWHKQSELIKDGLQKLITEFNKIN